MPSDQILDMVDNEDRPIGVIPRSEVFRRHANFRVAHILIFDSQGRLLIQRLAATRERHAGAWGSSVACYVSSGEDYSDAAVRRVREELGIIDIELTWVGRTRMLDEGSHKFIGLFFGKRDSAVIALPEHIAELRYVSLRELWELAQNGEAFTPTFRHIVSTLLGGTVRE